MRKLSHRAAAVGGRRVIVREDYNVPIREGVIQDLTRINASLPTIHNLRERQAAVVILSHLGRPQGVTPALSLAPVAAALSKALGTEVSFATDCVGEPARQVVAALGPGQVALLENLRFHPEEEANDPGFSAELAALGEIYVNDAFAVSHRAHASVVGITAFLPAYAGDLMQAELDALHRALDDPDRPLVAIVGGAKVSTKAGVLRNLLPRVDRLLIGGAMANTFIKAGGGRVGSSLVEESALAEAEAVRSLAGDKLVLPVDAVCAREVVPGAETRVMEIGAIEDGWMALDIGPASVELLVAHLRGAGTIVWNGPVGVFEVAPFGAGTRALAEAVAGSGAYTLVGGGDTAAAVESMGLAGRFSHVSTGGGATLEYMEGIELPGVAAIQDAP